jgi:hypothetical protein
MERGSLLVFRRLAQRLMHLAKTRLTVHLANAPLIAVGTLIAFGAFRVSNKT